MQWKNLRVTFVWLVINRKNKDWLDTDMVEKSITSRMHTWFKQKTKLDQICTVYWSIEKVRSLKKGNRVYRKHVIFDPLCTTWGEQWLNNHTLTCWASSSTRMMSPSSNCSCPSSDAAWFSSATPWCKTQITLMQTSDWYHTMLSVNFKKEQIPLTHFSGFDVIE